MEEHILLFRVGHVDGHEFRAEQRPARKARVMRLGKIGVAARQLLRLVVEHLLRDDDLAIVKSSVSGFELAAISGVAAQHDINVSSGIPVLKYWADELKTILASTTGGDCQAVIRLKISARSETRDVPSATRGCGERPARLSWSRLSTSGRRPIASTS